MDYKHIKTKKYNVEIETTEALLGTTPMNKELYKKFIESQKPKENEDEDESENVEDKEEAGWTGFSKDANGLFLYDYQIMGFLKNSGNVLKEQLGIQALKKKMTNFVKVYPRKIYLDKKEPDGVLERPLRGQTPKGERITLVRSDMVLPPWKINFSLHVIDGPIKTKVLATCLEYGLFVGLLQWRNGGYGRFKTLSLVEA